MTDGTRSNLTTDTFDNLPSPRLDQSLADTVGANATTKDELLRSAKDAIEASDQSLREAAEALGVAQELHEATQAEMARAIGKSEAWVSRLLRWRRSDYKDESPFGPRTKADRLKHAKDRAASGASKPRKSRKASTQAQAHADDAEVSAPMRKAEYAKQEAEPGNSISAGAQTSTYRKLCPAEAMENLRYAIDHYWPYMDNAGKDEITDYFLKKAEGVRVS
jgi:hypothetical protein